VQGKAGATNSQTFAGLYSTGGDNTLNVVSGASGSMNVNLGAITRGWCGLLNVNLPENGSVTTTTANADYTSYGGQKTILPGWITVNGNTWGVSAGNGTDAGAITGLTNYNAGFAAGKDVDAQTGASNVGAMTVNSLRFNNAGAASVNVGGGSGNLTIANGGILVTSNVGANNIAITCGAFGSQNGGTTGFAPGGTLSTLEVIQNNTRGTLTLNGAIDGTGDSMSAGKCLAIDKFGAGKVIIAAGDKFTCTGGSSINSGTLAIQNATDIQSSSFTVRKNATLQFDQTTANCVYAYEFDGAGTVLKTGSHSLELSGYEKWSTNVVVFNGNMNVADGTVILDNALLGEMARLVVDGDAGVTLNFSGEDTIGSLFLDGVAATVGTWGGTGSGASHISSLLSGVGVLNVTAVPEPTTLVMTLAAMFALAVYAWRRGR
jgi:fibronectin-binding autotransporter adhesin